MSEIDPMALNPIWWMDTWWEDVEYQTEHKVSLAQIREPIDALKALFDEQWTRRAIDAGPPNAVLPLLYGGRGLWPFQNLMWLGRIAKALVDVPSVQRPLRDLIAQKTRATLLEIEVASWFVEEGWTVEFLKASTEGKRPDIRILKDGISSAIECKRLESQKWEEWSEELSLTLIRRSAENGMSEAPSHDVLFEPRLSDLMMGEGPTKAGIIDELVERISTAVREAFATDPPRSVWIPGVAEIRPRPDQTGAQRGIGGIEISPQGVMRRIATNGILEAATQLRAYSPGAVVVRADFTPHEDLADIVLRGINRADSTLLSSVAVVVITASAGAPAVIWCNPALAEDPIRELLASVFTDILAGSQRLFRTPR
jgi:hypothetical protein